MTGNNETVAEIVGLMRDEGYYRGFMGITNPLTDRMVSSLLDRIEAAHKSEVKELCECLKEAIGCADEFQQFFEKHPYLCKYTRDIVKKSRKVREGVSHEEENHEEE